MIKESFDQFSLFSGINYSTYKCRLNFPAPLTKLYVSPVVDGGPRRDAVTVRRTVSNFFI